MLQRTHVVQAIGQLDQHHANVVHHGEHHLANVLRLRFFTRGEIDFADLGYTFDDVGNLFAELVADLFDGDSGIFDRVVQQPSRNRCGVELHLGQHTRHFEWMYEVRLSRGAGLAFMVLQGEFVGFFYEG